MIIIIVKTTVACGSNAALEKSSSKDASRPTRLGQKAQLERKLSPQKHASSK